MKRFYGLANVIRLAFARERGTSPVVIAALIATMMITASLVALFALYLVGAMSLSELGVWTAMASAFATIAGLGVGVHQMYVRLREQIEARERYPDVEIASLSVREVRAQSTLVRTSFVVRNRRREHQHNVMIGIEFERCLDRSSFRVSPPGLRVDVICTPSGTTSLVIEIPRLLGEQEMSITVDSPAHPIGHPVVVVRGHGEKAALRSERP